MAKKSDLKTSFGERIKSGRPTSARPIEKDNTDEQMISAQDRERRSRYGRKKSGDNSLRATDAYCYTSLALNLDLYNKVREIARRNALPYRDIINAAISKYIELYEAKNGVIKTPRESKISADSLI